MGVEEIMLQGICIDTGYTAVLQKGTSYYLFPNGDNHYYVSKFPNEGAHMGCFQERYFQVLEEEQWPDEPEIRLVSFDPEKLYKARLIWRKRGYKSVELKNYYIKSKVTHGYFYSDMALKECRGCFPLHWFTDFQETILDIIDQEIPDFDIDFEENDLILVESEPEIVNYVQMSIFDF
ncbi:hypothetical protein J1P26_22735 [Neobacillus sp. MM2021_6]|uniref:hypothetical protein n=1 Tax=Bacillaceae TaxID=186817 RepID=UPI00140A35AA|nr:MULTISPECIES: hypothetical protein [Bacillaceae]MBO0962515.1 hypothetical protein [Neobacillus sp. MM2021_6]NHC21007.1 hypothetical protein [Bacillus sp. MM2020_4]